jgi:hypothetical protein
MFHIADNMSQIRILVGTIIDAAWFPPGEDRNTAFVVVEEGLLGKHRLVNFAGLSRVDISLSIRFPKGVGNGRTPNSTSTISGTTAQSSRSGRSRDLRRLFTTHSPSTMSLEYFWMQQTLFESKFCAVNEPPSSQIPFTAFRWFLHRTNYICCCAV